MHTCFSEDVTHQRYIIAHKATCQEVSWPGNPCNHKSFWKQPTLSNAPVFACCKVARNVASKYSRHKLKRMHTLLRTKGTRRTGSSCSYACRHLRAVAQPPGKEAEVRTASTTAIEASSAINQKPAGTAGHHLGAQDIGSWTACI